jgi:hypothetical protein
VRYLKTAQGWLSALQQADADLVEAMEGADNLYRQRRDAETAFERMLTIAREIEQAKTPPSLMALQSTIEQSTSVYVQAARRNWIPSSVSARTKSKSGRPNRCTPLSSDTSHRTSTAWKPTTGWASLGRPESSCV